MNASTIAPENASDIELDQFKPEILTLHWQRHIPWRSTAQHGSRAAIAAHGLASKHLIAHLMIRWRRHSADSGYVQIPAT